MISPERMGRIIRKESTNEKNQFVQKNITSILTIILDKD